MKSFIKRSLRSFGYKIERLDNVNPLEPKFRLLVNEIHAILKQCQLTNLPELDNRYLDLITRLDGTQVTEAMYILSELERVKTLNGHICEFGVAQGFTSALMAYHILNSEKFLWLVDSFEGLPEPTEKDLLLDDIYDLGTIEAYAGQMKHDPSVLLNNLRRISFPASRTNVIKGFVEDIDLGKVLPNEISFAFVDFDFYMPIKVTLSAIDEKIVENGAIIVDDYNFFSEGAKLAVDEFHEENSSKYLLTVPDTSVGRFAILRKQNDK